MSRKRRRISVVTRETEQIFFDHSARLLTDLHSLLEAQLSTFHGHFMAPWSQNINTSKTIRSKSLMRELRAGSQMDTNKK